MMHAKAEVGTAKLNYNSACLFLVYRVAIRRLQLEEFVSLVVAEN